MTELSILLTVFRVVLVTLIELIRKIYLCVKTQHWNEPRCILSKSKFSRSSVSFDIDISLDTNFNCSFVFVIILLTSQLFDLHIIAKFSLFILEVQQNRIVSHNFLFHLKRKQRISPLPHRTTATASFCKYPYKCVYRKCVVAYSPLVTLYIFILNKNLLCNKFI